MSRHPWFHLSPSLTWFTVGQYRFAQSRLSINNHPNITQGLIGHVAHDKKRTRPGDVAKNEHFLIQVIIGTNLCLSKYCCIPVHHLWSYLLLLLLLLLLLIPWSWVVIIGETVALIVADICRHLLSLLLNDEGSCCCEKEKRTPTAGRFTVADLHYS